MNFEDEGVEELSEAVLNCGFSCARGATQPVKPIVRWRVAASKHCPQVQPTLFIRTYTFLI